MYEYRVIPAPTKGQKAKGVKSAEDRFAYAMSEILNQMAADGWDYQRAETLPSEERKGLTGKTTTFRNLLVFRREREWDEVEDMQPVKVGADEPDSTAPALPSANDANEVPEGVKEAPHVGDEDGSKQA
ncbi:DUF4177 domain-containing protein [Aliiroseovarius sp. KMU-50]|uniref:DUF4177 domain-containing protein n=1 Tax=Aliiroseovarius salicola TaxID=3009082 RepID=A0ABT4W1Q1_9RHOB|nr:DUF4177 domain-containing protein [Aliiroseovarius sp. KMU-50]MDA5094439.1 DUF4177 domain-containing protein [Aliiroseovarius sp. KMU-50]